MFSFLCAEGMALRRKEGSCLGTLALPTLLDLNLQFPPGAIVQYEEIPLILPPFRFIFQNSDELYLYNCTYSLYELPERRGSRQLNHGTGEPPGATIVKHWRVFSGSPCAFDLFICLLCRCEIQVPSTQ